MLMVMEKLYISPLPPGVTPEVLTSMHRILIGLVREKLLIISSFMSFTNDMDWTRTESSLHSIIPEHIMTCMYTCVSSDTCRV